MGDDLLLDFLVEEGREDDYALPTPSIDDFDGDEQDFLEAFIGNYEEHWDEDDDDDDEYWYDEDWNPDDDPDWDSYACGCCKCCGCSCDWGDNDDY